MTQSIIVYRNPGEEALWNMLMSGEFFAVFVGAIIGLIVVMVSERFLPRNVKRKLPYLSLMVGAVLWVAITWKMWL